MFEKYLTTKDENITSRPIPVMEWEDDFSDVPQVKILLSGVKWKGVRSSLERLSLLSGNTDTVKPQAGTIKNVIKKHGVQKNVKTSSPNND